MEEEAREILRTGLTAETKATPNLAAAIRRHFAVIGGEEIPPQPREAMRRPHNLPKMIVLDTNVLSETFKPSPSKAVLRWLAPQEPPEVFTTTITHAELLYGVELLRAGKRRGRIPTCLARLGAAPAPPNAVFLRSKGDVAAYWASISRCRGADFGAVSEFLL